MFVNTSTIQWSILWKLHRACAEWLPRKILKGFWNTDMSSGMQPALCSTPHGDPGVAYMSSFTAVQGLYAWQCYNKHPALYYMLEPVLLKKKSKGGFCTILPTQSLAWTLPAICRIQIPHFNRKAFKYLVLMKWEHPPFSLSLLLQTLQTRAVSNP